MSSTQDSAGGNDGHDTPKNISSDKGKAKAEANDEAKSSARSETQSAEQQAEQPGVTFDRLQAQMPNWMPPFPPMTPYEALDPNNPNCLVPYTADSLFNLFIPESWRPPVTYGPGSLAGPYKRHLPGNYHDHVAPPVARTTHSSEGPPAKKARRCDESRPGASRQTLSADVHSSSAEHASSSKADAVHEEIGQETVDTPAPVKHDDDTAADPAEMKKEDEEE